MHAVIHMVELAPRILRLHAMLLTVDVVLCMLQVLELLDTVSAGLHATYVLDAYGDMPGEIELVLCMLLMLGGIPMPEAVDAMPRVLEPVLGMSVLDLVVSVMRPGWHAPYPVSWTTWVLEMMSAILLSSMTLSFYSARGQCWAVCFSHSIPLELQALPLCASSTPTLKPYTGACGA